MTPKIQPTRHEVRLEPDDLIVTKTDTQGIITYANRTFMRIARFSEPELLGAPHNIVRHPDMPRAVFRLMWQTLQGGEEFFGYVKNLCSDGSFYWVIANVTPDHDTQGTLRGYYSVRRKPAPAAIETLSPIYRQMLEIEQRHPGQDGIAKAGVFLQSQLDALDCSYEALIYNLLQQDA